MTATTIPPNGPRLRCPRCRQGSLAPVEGKTVSCNACNATWPVVAGIFDLRSSADPFLSAEEDRASATALAARVGLSFADLLASYYEGNALVPRAQATAIIQATLAAPTRSRAFLAQVQRMMACEVTAAHHVLDLGAGTAPLTVETARCGAAAWAVDIGLRWLVLARQRAADEGVSFEICAAGADDLPFADASFDMVFAESVLEWLPDQPRALAEAFRVLRPGGRLALSTPNRFSPGPDPHLGVPLGSWLSPAGVAAVARLRGVLPPPRHLLNRSALHHALGAAGFVDVVVAPPDIAMETRAASSVWLRAGIAAWELARATPGLNVVAGQLAPVHVAVAIRPVQG